MNNRNSASQATTPKRSQTDGQPPRPVVPVKAGTSTSEAPLSAQRLLELYDRVADAPEAIGRLRKFVLDLAVRGKLVEQDPADESAVQLLKRIQEEKEQLVKAGEVKKPKKLPPVEAESYALPANWALVPLGEVILTHLGGGTPSKSNETYWNGDINWASVKDIGKSKYLDDTIDRITEAGLANSSSNLIDSGNLIVVTRMGLGKVSINRIPVAINQDLRALFLSTHISVDYTYNFFLTHGFEGTGLTVKGIKLQELLTIPFPLPPLAEQQRIMARVNQLMALLDHLEATRTRRETTRNRLTTTSLTRLTAPETTEADFAAHARFALDNLDQLTSRPEQIKELRQTILNLAVRGKLVEQNAADEPVSIALSSIGAMGQPDGAFSLPKSWAWVEVASVAETRLGKMLDKSKNKGTPRQYLRNINVRWFDFDLSNLLEMRFEDSELEEFSLRAGDVLICEGGEPGRAAVWDSRESDIYFQKAIHRVRFSELVNPHHFLLALKASADDGRLAQSFTGTGIKHFTSRGLRSYSFPLPPLAEQHRIVEKVDTLMKLCDKLEIAKSGNDSTKGRLLQVLLHDSLAQDAHNREAV